MHTKDQIVQHVKHELAWETDVDGSHVLVSERDGVVTLSGVVCSYDQKIAAEEAAQRVVGVAAVTNEIQVILADGSRLDEDIARVAASAIRFQLPDSADAIRVVVDGGMVQLEGQVQWNCQRQRAEQAVRRIAGVRAVANHINLQPAVVPADVQRSIAAAFRRNALVHASQLHVEVKGGEVTLSGSVRSWDERQAAERAVWMAPGVISVVNRIMVEARAVS